MNVLFFLIPKVKIAYVNDDDTIRQALEKMHHYRYTAIPVLDKDGLYVGTISEGDLLWYLKDSQNLNLFQTDGLSLKLVPRYHDSVTMNANTEIEDLYEVSTKQNFVPIVDDRGAFIGIITRKDIITYMIKVIDEVKAQNKTK